MIVIEAGEKSGSLDTAPRARKQSRLVLAVPGSTGPETLIASGATPIDGDQPDWDWLIGLIEQPPVSGASDNLHQTSLW